MRALHNPVPVLVVSGMPKVYDVDVEAEALRNGAFLTKLWPAPLRPTGRASLASELENRARSSTRLKAK
jgi:hypothetical protein